MEPTSPQPHPNLPVNFRIWLQREFMMRCKRNPKYSLRAFAQLVGLNSSSLSQILSGKRKVSRKLAEKICDQLNPEPQQRKIILAAFQKENGKVDALPGSANPEGLIESDEHYQQLTLDAFTVISEWYHYAILELTFIKSFKSNSKWIARTLGLTAVEASAAVERLQRLGLLEIKDDVMKKTTKFVSNYSEGLTSPALKELQRQVLQMALQAIDNTPQEAKDITSMTMAIDVNKLGEAREHIKNFRRSLCQFLETGNQTQVYQMGIQLYPVSKIIEDKE